MNGVLVVLRCSRLPVRADLPYSKLLRGVDKNFYIFFFHRLELRQVHFIYSYSILAWGLHGGVDMILSGGLFVLDLI
jgi:hypothetical protein